MSGQRLHDIRTKLGLNLREVSQQTGGRLSRSRLWNYENGERKPGLGEITMLAQVFRVRVSWLLGVETETQTEILDLFDTLPEVEKKQVIAAFSILINAIHNKVQTPPATPPPDIVTPLRSPANNNT